MGGRGKPKRKSTDNPARAVETPALIAIAAIPNRSFIFIGAEFDGAPPPNFKSDAIC